MSCHVEASFLYASHNLTREQKRKYKKETKRGTGNHLSPNTSFFSSFISLFLPSFHHVYRSSSFVCLRHLFLISVIFYKQLFLIAESKSGILSNFLYTVNMDTKAKEFWVHFIVSAHR